MKNVVFMKEKAHVGFWRRGINKTVATSTFPITVPIILDHPVYPRSIENSPLSTVKNFLLCRYRIHNSRVMNILLYRTTTYIHNKNVREE